MASIRERILAGVQAFRDPGRVKTLLTAAPPEKKREIKGNYAFNPVFAGRQTQPTNYNPFGLSGWYFIPKRQYQEIDVEELDVTQFTADQLLALLPDLNPDFSKAVWNYLRIAGTDVEFECLTPDGAEFAAGQKNLDDLILGTNPQFAATASDAALSGWITSVAASNAVDSARWRINSSTARDAYPLPRCAAKTL